MILIIDRLAYSLRRGYRVFFLVLGPPPPYGCLQYVFYIQTHRC